MRIHHYLFWVKMTLVDMMMMVMMMMVVKLGRVEVSVESQSQRLTMKMTVLMEVDESVCDDDDVNDTE